MTAPAPDSEIDQYFALAVDCARLAGDVIKANIAGPKKIKEKLVLG